MWSGGLHFIVTEVSVTPSTARRVGGLVTAEASRQQGEGRKLYYNSRITFIVCIHR